MAVLGTSEIIRHLRDGLLVVSPILSRSQIGPASIDLRMGTVVLMPRSRGSSHVDPAAAKAMRATTGHALEIDRQQKQERYEVPFNARFLLHPGALALVPTLEWVKLPGNLQGSVTARSTWAREGLSIATATFIEPGYQGIVTLELANLSPIPIALYPGLKLAQIAFMTVDGETQRSDNGQFHLSFEPKQGQIAKDDELRFIPTLLGSELAADR